MLKDVLHKIDEFLEKHRWILVFLLALPFVNQGFPNFYYVYVWLHDWQKVVSLLILIWFCFRKKHKLTKLPLIAIVSEVWLLLITGLNQGFEDMSVYEDLYNRSSGILFLVLIADIFSDQIDHVCNGLMLNYEIAIYPYFAGLFFKLFPVVTKPRGLMNTFIMVLLPAMFLALVHLVQKKQVIRSVVLLVCSLLTVWKFWCATTVVAVLATAAVLLFGFITWKLLKHKISLSAFLFLSLLLNLFVLFVYSGGMFPWIDTFIQSFLKRSTTFTERTIIWEEAIRMIKEKPLFGYGIWPLIHAENSYASVYIHAHNELLQQHLEGGVIRFVLFLAFHAELARKVDRRKSSFVRIVAIAFVFGLSMTYITESYERSYLLFAIPILSYYLK